MDQDPKSEAEATEKLQKLKDTPADQFEKPDQVVGWLINSVNRYEILFSAAVPVLSAVLLKCSLSVESTLKILNFYKKNSQKCKGDLAPQYVVAGISACALCVDDVTTTSESLLTAIRPSVYSHENTQTNAIEALKEVVIPRMKTLAEAKRYREALNMWRSVVKFTRFEKVPTNVTNKILHVATMAFKESDPEIHIDVFNSWKTFIERLPESTVRKSNYVSLLLNPLNRVYRDTESETNVHKFSVWWQLVRSLRSHAENNFDQVVMPLIQKVFNLSRSQQAKSAFDLPQTTRLVTREAYAVFALVLYRGNNEILKEMNGLHEKFPVNQHVLKDEHFVKHSALMREVLEIIVSNILEGSSPPPEVYPYLLLKILISRASSLYESDAHDLSRVFMSNAMKLLRETRLDPEQSLGIFGDLANGTPQKLIVTGHFVPEFAETPLAHVTVHFINRVSVTCSQGTENQRKRFKSLLRVLLERASSDFLPFAEHVVSNFEDIAPSLEIPIWLELVERLCEVIAHTHEVNQGSDSKPNFSAILSCLRYPFKKPPCLTQETVKSWSKLFTVFAANAILVKNIVPNQQIEEVCQILLEELILSENNLHRLMLYSQALDSVVRQVASESVPDKRPLGNLESLVKCLSHIAKTSSHFISDEKRPKSDSQLFVNVVTIFYHLIHTVQDSRVCKAICNALLPDLLQLYEFTRTRNIIRETCLHQVEAPLTNILGQLSEELVARAAAFADDSQFPTHMKHILNVAASHWKRSIRDTFIAYANSISAPVVEGDQSSQSLSQFIGVSDAVPVFASKAPTVQEKAPSAVQEKSPTPVVKRRSSRKNSKVVEKEDFTPIKSAKKKSIFTEHQLEKQAESKVIPSMYQDLSQSVDKNPSQTVVDTEVGTTVTTNAPVVDENANFDVELKAEEKDDVEIVQAPELGNVEEDKKSSADNPNVGMEIEGIRPIESPDDTEAAALPPTEGVNNENDEPVAKKKKRFSYNEGDDMPDPVEIDQQPSSLVKMAEKIQQQQQQQQLGDVEGAAFESPMRGFAARKRKLGQNFESPILMRMPPKNAFLVNSPSSRSRKMLEAAQAKQGGQTDIRNMLAGSTPRHNKCFPIHDNPQAASPPDDRRLTFAAPTNGFGASSPPSARRSILKRFSTGASVKRVSFSRSNEVCAFLKNRTAKSLFPPFTVKDDDNGVAVEETEASPRVDLCEKSFCEDLEESPETAENENDRDVSICSTINNSVRLELEPDEDSCVKKVLFDTDDAEQDTNRESSAADAEVCRADDEELMDAENVVETSSPQDAQPCGESSPNEAKDSVSVEIQTEAAQPLSEANLVDLIREAEGENRKQVLAHVSSPEFLGKMTSNERNAFAIRVFASIGFYVA
ncbi:uncharacterized protein LOC100908168 [Galendromus occidentalis]|uniref:Uncharacterized protein LOC100908168 n=1 Tax=Galendromus occidentalis TaxID=34638 RepID=A0AAJ6VXS7_9ACAR|nr:uncharacterized protein LOC100908168 [Galendromus occidentalis]